MYKIAESIVWFLGVVVIIYVLCAVEIDFFWFLLCVMLPFVSIGTVKTIGEIGKERQESMKSNDKEGK